ncbi:hypothetical protein B0H66DRAFT_590568 [Apodospora peruviana]|uniref:Uncharacterized protein n=1 Tax=Apodospora peruviana TaxID=516989 RepID=A0AAE0ID63_9PEZI|nr:hypothetical protein B0H66DRAFT_590568 [Apodospora peruviana]
MPHARGSLEHTYQMTRVRTSGLTRDAETRIEKLGNELQKWVFDRQKWAFEQDYNLTKDMVLDIVGADTFLRFCSSSTPAQIDPEPQGTPTLAPPQQLAHPLLAGTQVYARFFLSAADITPTNSRGITTGWLKPACSISQTTTFQSQGLRQKRRPAYHCHSALGRHIQPSVPAQTDLTNTLVAEFPHLSGKMQQAIWLADVTDLSNAMERILKIST